MYILRYFFSMDGENYTVENEEFTSMEDLNNFVEGTGVEIFDIKEK